MTVEIRKVKDIDNNVQIYLKDFLKYGIEG